MFSNHLHALTPRTRISNVEWEKGRGGRKWRKHSNDRINLFLPSFSFLPFFLFRFIDSFLWIREGRKINLELLIEGGKGGGGRSIHFRDSLLIDLRSTRGNICNEHRWRERGKKKMNDRVEEEEKKKKRGRRHRVSDHIYLSLINNVLLTGAR